MASGETIVVTGMTGALYFQLCAQISALKLEILGLRHSRGSVYAHVKRRYGLRGSKQAVLDQLQARKEQMLADRAQEVGL